MTSSPALLPCPFCGMDCAVVRAYDNETSCDIVCKSCRASTGRLSDIESANAAWNRREALLSRAATTQVGESPEEQAEHFIAEAIDRGPEPLRRLGEYLSNVLDEDQFKTAERMLIGSMIEWAPSQPVAPVVPDGFALVPIEPTQEMKEAWAQYKRYCNEQSMQRTAGGHYRAMIAAAPHPAQPQPSSEQPVMSKSMAKRIAAQLEQEPTAEDFREAWDDRCSTQEACVSVVMVSGFDELLARARDIARERKA